MLIWFDLSNEIPFSVLALDYVLICCFTVSLGVVELIGYTLFYG